MPLSQLERDEGRLSIANRLLNYIRKRLRRSNLREREANGLISEGQFGEQSQMSSISLAARAVAGASITLRVRPNIAIHHLLGACRQSARVQTLEKEHIGKPFGDFWNELYQSAISVAVLTTAFLETYANEMWFEGGTLAPQMEPAAMAAVLKAIEKRPVLEKFDVALAFRTGRRLDLSAGECQDVSALIQLRNQLLHFSPEWLDEQSDHEKLSKRLAYKCHASPFFVGSERLFPRAWASAASTAWALRTAVRFVHVFSAESGNPNGLAPFMSQLSQLAEIDVFP